MLRWLQSAKRKREDDPPAVTQDAIRDGSPENIKFDTIESEDDEIIVMKRRALKDKDVAQAQNNRPRVLKHVLIPRMTLSEQLLFKSPPQKPKAIPQPKTRRPPTPESEEIVMEDPVEEVLPKQESLQERPTKRPRRSAAQFFVFDDGSEDEQVTSKKASKTKLSAATKRKATKEESESEFEGDVASDGEAESEVDEIFSGEESDDSTPASEPQTDDDGPPSKSRKREETKSKAKPVKAGTSVPAEKGSSHMMENLLKNDKGVKGGLDPALPPLSNIRDIFTDITKKAMSRGLTDAVEHLGDYSIKVATMCSGTESPLLALRMFQEALESLGSGTTFTVDHLFSAEIVPYKQAYIERNFKPPVIFRDITELTDAVKDDIPMATTAYGARVPVPTKIDLLVAGTSCVDFSRLNNRQKGLEGGGESDKTWHAVLAYCVAFQPPIVLLENVKGAHWDKMLRHYEEAGYETAGVHVDTKDFYMPQTRQRGYMVCFHKEKMAAGKVKGAGGKWQSLMKAFKRKASSPVSSFLLPNNEITYRQARLDEGIREVDWSACEIRQMQYRQQTGIGNARPFTNWQESGTISLPETDSAQYISKQVERVKDVIECATLRKAMPKNGMYDVRYKTRIWDLSQNIDRFQDTAPFGITGCITPSGQFFISDAGRAITSEELLVLQGLPLDKISFTTESEREIQDLAGNAMSASVVGCALVSAIICGHKLFDITDTSEIATTTQTNASQTKLIAANDAHDSVYEETESTLSDINMNELLAMAEKSSRKCYCEGAIGLAEKPIQQCRDCGHTTCLRCGGNPKHNYSQRLELSSSRLSPALFEETLRSQLPLQLSFQDVDIACLKMEANHKSNFIDGYVNAVQLAVDGTFHLSHFRRTYCWTIFYRSPSADLQLVLDGDHAEWRLFARPEESLASKDQLRQALDQPVAKCTLSKELMFGQWKWRVPTSSAVSLKIIPRGEQVPSWWSRIGIPEMKDHFMHNELEVIVPKEHENKFDQPIGGTYKYIQPCGTACESLFKRIDGDETLYLFLDPTRTGNPDEDPFVFSKNIERLNYDEIRSVVAQISRPWVPWGDKKKLSSEPMKAESPVEFVWKSSDMCIRPNKVRLNFNTAQTITTLPSRNATCDEAPILQACHVETGSKEQSDSQLSMIQPDDGPFFASNAWLFEAMRRKLNSNEQWRELPNQGLVDICTSCAPPKPSLRWKLASDGDTITPYEDSSAAAEYERAIKSRSMPIIIEADLRMLETLSVKFAVNIRCLAHRARSRLPATIDNVSFKWRLSTKPAATFNNRPFAMSNTAGIEPFTGKLPMSVSLFPNQQLVLAWMKQQELGVDFVIEESEEARIPELGWRAEVCVEARVRVRGGICADHPGFGKTITSLALICEQYNREDRKAIVESISHDSQGLIPISATLIVCPAVLLKQWQSEIQDKLQWKDGVFAINTTADLRKYKITDFKNAKIIIVNRQVLGSEQYAERLAVFAGTPGPATKSGRSFAQWLEFATKQIPEHLKAHETGLTELKRQARAKYKELLNSDSFQANVPSRRLRGKNYVAGGKTVKSAAAMKTAAAAELNTEGIDTPLLEMFYFNRIVIDEFHQYEAKEYAALKGLKCHKRWGLSATPALDDFYDIAQMAGLLGIPLRVGSDARGIMKAKNVRELRREMTDFERFDAMRQIPSDSVHARIHEIDQLFLDTFVRRNIMDFGEIKYRDSLAPVGLDLDHRAAYTELSQHLNSLDMRIRKGKKNQNTDRNELLREAVSDSATAEEALSKAAAIFDRKRDTDMPVTASGLQSWISRREQEVAHAMERLHAALWVAKKDDSTALADWIKTRIDDGTIGDESTIADVRLLVKSLGSALPASVEKLVKTMKATSSKQSKSKKSKDDSDSDGEETGRALKPATVVNNSCNWLVTSQRSLRFLRSIQELQASSGKVEACQSASCHKGADKSDVAVSAFCGHTVCRGCYDRLQLHQCPADGCTAQMHSFHLLWTSKMGDLKNQTNTSFGGKVEAVLSLLKQIQKQNDQAILFVQYASQLYEVETALRARGIQATVVSEGSKASAQIADFQSRTTNRSTVIVLNASDETAAGSNLQNANHVIFFSPLLRDSQYGYDATMAQAIGRARRHGQQKKIFVYRVLALDTIDVDILEHRERRSTALAEESADDIEAPESLMEMDEPARERTQLVRENDIFSLRPQSWLVDRESEMEDVEMQKVRGKYRVAGWEDFSSLVKFSRAYTEDDD